MHNISLHNDIHVHYITGYTRTHSIGKLVIISSDSSSIKAYIYFFRLCAKQSQPQCTHKYIKDAAQNIQTRLNSWKILPSKSPQRNVVYQNIWHSIVHQWCLNTSVKPWGCCKLSNVCQKLIKWILLCQFNMKNDFLQKTTSHNAPKCRLDCASQSVLYPIAVSKIWSSIIQKCQNCSMITYMRFSEISKIWSGGRYTK